MPALVAGIHVFLPFQAKTWMAGPSPAMTTERVTHSAVCDYVAEGAAAARMGEPVQVNAGGPIVMGTL
jgi:hypothetical protein